VVGAIRRLRDDKGHLRGRIDWDQAVRDNEALEGVIKERRDLATKDWKAEYDRLVNENKVLQTEMDKYRSNGYKAFSVRLRATNTRYWPWDPWVSYTTNEEVYGTGELLPSMYGSNMYLVRNNAGQVGVAQAEDFIRI